MLVELSSATFGYEKRPIVSIEQFILTCRTCVGIFGPNGVGKTTLVRGIAGLLPPIEGVVQRDTSLRFGYLQQHRSMELHWPMSALDVAALAVSVGRRLGWVRGAFPRVHEQAAALGVDHLLKKCFATLSGGQQQRVLLAGALAAEPDVLILDEPTDGLDVQSRRILLDRLRLAMLEGLSVVLVSHEPRDLLALDADIYVLEPSKHEDEPSRVLRVDAAHLAEHVMGRI